jgi:putative component of membrane protein insertase Oxa1/YidC/SpoIIIJ protein YidD
MLRTKKQTPLIDTIIRAIAVNSINGYQRYISPYKGYSCAHRLLWGGASCSEYVKQIVAKEDLITAIKKSRQRFRDCTKANRILRSQTTPPDDMENQPPNPENPDQIRDNSYNRNDRCSSSSQADCACMACELISLLDFCNFS